jgi:hypothetical protein
MAQEATSSQAIHPLPPGAEQEAAAMAPLGENADDKSQYDRLKDDKGFAEFLNKIADYATAHSNSDQMWERRRKTVQLRKYLTGEYYGIFDRHKGWTSAKEDGDGIYFDPATATFIAELMKDLVKTRPKLRCEPRDPESIEKREAARVAERLLEMDAERDFTPRRQQREWKTNLLCAGETYRITYFDPKKTGCGFHKPVFEPVQIGAEGEAPVVYCPLCGANAADESGACAQCGNPQLDAFEVQGTTVHVRKGESYQQIGDTDFDVPDALEMTVVGDTDHVGEALIVRRSRMIPRCVLRAALGDKELPSTGTPENLQYKQLFDGKSSTDGSIDEFEMLNYEEYWIAPAVYSGYDFPKDARTRGGAVIPQGTNGAEVAPEGFYFSRIKKSIKLLYPQAIGEAITHCVNDIGDGFHGQGEWDLLELQDQATEATSMKMNSMLLDSTQPLIYREGYVDADQFENKFGVMVEAKDYPRDMSLDQLMTRVKPGSPPAEAYQVGEEIKGKMQQRVGAFSTTTDAPDIKAMGTATGVNALENQAVTRRIPALLLYGQLHVDQGYQILEMRRKYWPAKMYAAVAAEMGEDAVQWFMRSNIRQDIRIGLVRDSWMPVTETQRQQGFQTFLALTGQLIAATGNVKMMDEIVRKASELYGAGINFNDYEKEATEAQLRLDKLKDVGGYVEQQFGALAYDPTGAAASTALLVAYQQTAQLLRLVHPARDEADIFAQLPLDVMYDDHGEFIEAYTDWLKTAEGRAASQFIRTLVHELAVYHDQAVSAKQIRMKELQNATMLPDLEAQTIANDAANDQQLTHNAQQREQEMLYSGIEQAVMPQEQPTQ